MLSEVYIKGFKTFARPVRMPFGSGITAIVGPNGSGKSNITDAVLFALGEQSPSLLRAGGMGDLIFSGSDSLSSAATAEVTLVFDNSSGVISLPYREVAVTRRISREGETEYRINGSRSRLSDVRSVAGEAGLGRHNILRQGAVDDIVAGGAAACRNALEEAAGLGVYRRRRQSASRRLARAEDQLHQSRQLEAELADQLQRIEREAAAAREYRELESRYRRLSLAHLYRVATHGLDEHRRTLREQESTVYELESRERELRAEEAELGSRMRELDSGIEGLERSLEALEGRSESLRAGSLRLERLGVRFESVRDRREQKGRLISRLDEELQEADRRLEELGPRSDEVESELSEVRGELERSREEHSRAEREHASAVAERDDLAASLERLHGRRERNEARLGEATAVQPEEIRQLYSRASGLEGLLERETSGKETRSLRERLVEQRRRAGEQGSGLSRRHGELSSAIRRAENAVSRLASSAHGDGSSPRLHEIIRARPGYEAAVEAALGELGEGVLAADLEEGVRLLSGSEWIAVRLDARRVEEDERPPGRPLLECVEVLDGRYADAVERLLGGTRVVESPEQETPANGYVAVTREGLRLTRTSVSLSSGGDGFASQARLAEETHRLEALQRGPAEALRRMEEDVSAAGARLDLLESDVETLASLDDRLARAARSLAHNARSRTERLEGEREKAEEARRDAGALEREISTTGEKLREARESAERTGSELSERRAAVESVQSALREAEARQKSLSEAAARERERRRRLSAELERVEGASEDRLRELESISSRASETMSRLTADVHGWRERLRERRAETSETHRRVSREHSSISQRSSELAGELATARAEEKRIREELERAEASASHAEEEIRNEWNATLEDARQEAESLPDSTGDERKTLSRRLNRFGDVNLLALSREGEIRERHDFIAAQRADAESASEELNRIIQGIDRGIEESFAETFARVSSAFEEVVPRMMQGAAGRLELSEEGVEIGVRLGRRGWRPLRVLSGGERALLALSFLFSIFLSRLVEGSGAFCMLDEAEATLDDVNLARFLAVVDSYRDGGQFLLVTHQRRTMAAADVLCGVTQDSAGATQVVSKRLQGE